MHKVIPLLLVAVFALSCGPAIPSRDTIIANSFAPKKLSSDVVMRRLLDYYGHCTSSGDVEINGCMAFSLPPEAKIVDSDNIDREYDGNYVNLITIDGILNKVAFHESLYFHYREPHSALTGILQAINGTHAATKGYYDYGEALKGLKVDASRIVANKTLNETVFAKTVFNAVTKQFDAYVSIDIGNSEYNNLTVAIHSPDSAIANKVFDRMLGTLRTF